MFEDDSIAIAQHWASAKLFTILVLYCITLSTIIQTCAPCHLEASAVASCAAASRAELKRHKYADHSCRFDISSFDAESQMLVRPICPRARRRSWIGYAHRTLPRRDRVYSDGSLQLFRPGTPPNRRGAHWIRDWAGASQYALSAATCAARPATMFSQHSLPFAPFCDTIIALSYSKTVFFCNSSFSAKSYIVRFSFFTYLTFLSTFLFCSMPDITFVFLLANKCSISHFSQRLSKARVTLQPTAGRRAGHNLIFRIILFYILLLISLYSPKL